jgi:hypothetical protein
MSDTPRTDTEARRMTIDCDDSCVEIYVQQDGKTVAGDIVLADFARQLERELNAAKANANAIDEAAKRMEEVDSLLSTKLFLPGRKTLGEAMEDFRTRLIKAAKGEQL